MKNIIKVSLILGFLFTTSIAHADFSSQDWQYVKEITNLPSTTEPVYVRVDLDNEAAGTGNNFNDVRIIAGNEIEVPYQLIIENASGTDCFYNTRVASKYINPDGRLMFIIDVGEANRLHNALNITITPATRNFRRQVYVYSSDTLLAPLNARWQLITDRGYIYELIDDTINFRSGHYIVTYPDSKAKYIRIVIDNPSDEPIDVLGVNIYRYEVSSAKKNSMTLPAQVTENKEKKSTELLIDLGGNGVFSDKVELYPTGENFSRKIAIQSSSDNKQWRMVTQGLLFNLVTPKFKGTNTIFEYPEITDRYVKVIIYNEDDAPLNITPELKVSSIVRTVVFKYTPGGGYSLYYGNSKARTPHYDLARFFKYLDLNVMMSEVYLSAGKNNPSYVPTPEPLTSKLQDAKQNQFLLNVILAILTIIIGIFIFFYIRRCTITDKSKDKES